MSQLLLRNKVTAYFMAVLMTLTLSLPSCAYTYRGDGTFEDRGFSTASRRYWLSLDTISINKHYKRSFTVGYFPESAMTLSFVYTLDDQRLEESQDAVFDTISRIKIRLKISIKETGEVKYFYEGNLHERGKKDGKFFMEGLTQGYFVDSKRGNCLTWTLAKYDFNEVVSILGFETSFPKKIDRVIEFEIIEPLTKPIKEGGDFFELVIYGGGWK